MFELTENGKKIDIIYCCFISKPCSSLFSQQAYSSFRCSRSRACARHRSARLAHVTHLQRILLCLFCSLETMAPNVERILQCIARGDLESIQTQLASYNTVVNVVPPLSSPLGRTSWPSLWSRYVKCHRASLCRAVTSAERT